MKKIVFVLAAAATLCGCSSKNKSSVSSEKEVVVPATSAESTSVIEEVTASTTEAMTEAEQDSDFQILEVGDDGITVILPNNIMQKIEIDCTELLRMAGIYNHDPTELLFIEDYNFDGYDDLFVPKTTLLANTPGTYYRFDPTVNFNPLKKWDVLNEIGFLMKADSENGILHFITSSSAVYHNWIIYKWDNGKLQPVSREYQYEGDKQIYIDCFEYDNDGKEILVRRKRAILGENNEWLGTEDVELS